MERQLHDAVDDLVGALEEITEQASALHAEARDPKITGRTASLQGQCERALVDAKKIAYLSTRILHREPALRLVLRRQ